MNRIEYQKPTVQLIGQNGNAFAIMGACRKAARRAGWTDEQWRDIQQEMTAGNYNNLLQTAMKYFEVE